MRECYKYIIFGAKMQGIILVNFACMLRSWLFMYKLVALIDLPTI